MSIAAAAAPLVEGEATGIFGRTANFLSGAHGINSEHTPVPVPKDAPVGTAESLAKSTINPGAVVA